ncbi:MAG TPA: DUF302 domain-containing protein, partial [Polyangia bacterium]|nr:DUF302 domain-containing protein [Polyangia bacterium]
MTPSEASGLVDRPSNHSVEETVARLTELLRAKGATLFALVDHSGEAERVGLAMHPTKLLIFGNPRAGTPAMLAEPRSAIDFPLKILVWEDAGGTTWITTNSPDYLRDRHGLATELTAPLA